MNRLIFVAALLPALAGCDQLKERMGMPDPAKLEAEGKAIGGACRHAGRGLEDCYRLNPDADKSSVFTGWKEMNEYMLKNNMQAVTPEIPVEMPGSEEKKTKKAKKAEEGDHGDAAGGAHGDKTAEGHGDAEAKKDEAKKDDAKKPAAKEETHDKAAGGH